MQQISTIDHNGKVYNIKTQPDKVNKERLSVYLFLKGDKNPYAGTSMNKKESANECKEWAERILQKYKP